ncbi:MAG: hypothetical protein ACR2NM_14815 [Bythopirellula sp.]
MLILADIFENIIGAIFVIFWIAVQILGGRQDAKKKQKPPRQRPPQRQPADLGQPVNLAGGEPRPPGPPNQEEALRNEVEEFLRRAQGKPPQPKPVPQPAAVRKPQPPRPTPPRKAPVAPVKPRTLRNEGVAEHVARHLSTQEMAQRTKTLGAEVALSDDRLESHLHEKFDHKLGRLQHHDAADEEKLQAANVAAEVAAMLRSPQGMRQLIIANEILRRPDW